MNYYYIKKGGTTHTMQAFLAPEQFVKHRTGFETWSGNLNKDVFKEIAVVLLSRVVGAAIFHFACCSLCCRLQPPVLLYVT